MLWVGGRQCGGHGQWQGPGPSQGGVNSAGLRGCCSVRRLERGYDRPEILIDFIIIVSVDRFGGRIHKKLCKLAA